MIHSEDTSFIPHIYAGLNETNQDTQEVHFQTLLDAPDAHREEEI